MSAGQMGECSVDIDGSLTWLSRAGNGLHGEKRTA